MGMTPSATWQLTSKLTNADVRTLRFKRRFVDQELMQRQLGQIYNYPAEDISIEANGTFQIKPLLVTGSWGLTIIIPAAGK